jgi:glucose/mannose-6-phosphate isomerase
MYEAIMGSQKQFAFKPQITNERKLKKLFKYVVVGMGGSHLAADILKMIKPELDIIVRANYGLPILTIEELKERLIILSSYSGNTEESLDAYEEAGKFGLARAVISIGGKLLEKAKQDQVPYIEMPNFHIQPRSALALTLKSLLRIIGEEKNFQIMGKLAKTFQPEKFEEEGKKLAKKLYGYVPIIYASEKNQTLAYNWKIKFNETGKIPAFYNVFPELNHNEMTGFDVRGVTRNLSDKFYFIFLLDKDDHPKIQHRMSITAKLYEKRNLKTCKIILTGKNIFQKVFENLTLADFAAYFTAERYGLESEEVPMVEEFKKLIER